MKIFTLGALQADTANLPADAPVLLRTKEGGFIWPDVKVETMYYGDQPVAVLVLGDEVTPALPTTAPATATPGTPVTSVTPAA